MQSTITATQQPLPVFRQPTGVHLPHYPPNYIPYGPYFSPFYVPPPAIHQFLSNGAFPQQPQAGSLYPTAPGTTAKYSVSQYKQGTNTGSSTLGVPGNYGPYGLSMANYTSSSATAAVSSTSNEDVSAPQVKENNVYVSGQQNEGSGVWFTTHSRDIPTLQASSFYNLPQGQLAFTPTQPGHGTFTGIFHPAQAVTAANVHPLLQQSQAITNPVDMVGPTASVYQQPQHAQLNWPSNY
ncbi:UNVERIFIED_CONTAM: GBF-interacting protein 1-like [Sesamum angustifolium]|uniref:GBF-interacting protein 1-like n=1 Tax=Sesamum angustifolium TaxID=2727405 RepID=A0AAW2PEL5_9LAMI